ncbi:MAG: hypothetical protein LUD12_13270 [Lachnospiraceae bacterium]|nr:hypothetical protein [Lachnospiraceae bacterium]
MNDINSNVYISLMKHCIGMDSRKPYKRHGKIFYKPYRNYFSTAEKGKDAENWKTIMDAGYAKRREIKNKYGGYVYWLTRAGLDWLGEKLGMHIYDEE